MGRSNVKKLRIPIEESLFTFGSGYEVGPRLRLIQNFMRRPMGSSGITIFPFGVPEVPKNEGPVLTSDAENISGMGFWVFDGTHFYVGGNETGGAKVRAIWDMETGAQVPVLGLSLGNNAVGFPWSFAFASNVAEPTTFLVNQGSPKKKIHADIGGLAEIVDWSPVFDPDGIFGFTVYPRIVYYHLNRVWIVYTSSITRRSIVYYSDPLNPDLIRPDSFIDIPDECVSVFRASASDIDLGSQAHLIFGCKGSMFVLDGDPTLGNSTFRQMRKTWGINSAHHVIETSEGAAFLATDDKVYLLPRGAIEPVPINKNIKSQFTHVDTTIRLGWKYPYIYILNRPQEKIWLCDLSDLQEEPYWSGPHTGLAGMAGLISDIPYTQVSYMPVFEPAQSFTLGPSLETQLLRTGYIFEEDCDVVFARTWFDFRQFGTVGTAKFRVYNNQGLQEEFIIDIPSFGIGSNSDTIFKVRVVAQPRSMEFGDYFWMELEGSALTRVRNWHIEYRVEPRKD